MRGGGTNPRQKVEGLRCKSHLPQLLGATAGLDGEALEHEEQAAAVDKEAEGSGDTDEGQEDAAGDAARLHQPTVRQHVERPQPHLRGAGRRRRRWLAAMFYIRAINAVDEAA